MDAKGPIRVAIVGSGMAGLVTAYLLHRDSRQRYAVKLFESGKSLSLDSASVSVPNASGTSTDRVDLPMRAFAGGYYNNLKAMYDHLGVKYHSQPFLFEFAMVHAEAVGRRNSNGDPSYFIHASNLHKMPPPRPSAVATISYLAEVVYLLACYTWFSLCCFLVAPRIGHRGLSETLDDYLKRIWLPEYFATYYLLPLISSVTTCPHKSLLAFPASDLTEYKRKTNGAPHYTVSNGVKAVQGKLVEGIDYELAALVSAVEPSSDGVRLRWKRDHDNTETESRMETFDRVVLAVSPDIVGQVFETLRRAMSRIPTMPVESVVHNDRSTLGAEEFGESSETGHSAQLISLRTSSDGTNRTESIHVQPSGALVTTCPFSPIDPSLTLHSAIFTRVLRSPESRRIVNSIFGDTHDYFGDEKGILEWKNGDGNVWLVGGWCWDGMVLLEGCVISAMRVADAFGVEVPWRH
ncbi:hypothetical protein K469DRAFT_596538 [Zopfia rhizophila CBS 207.26]|uniref:FAD/NAD(P)-binding domain-containing protein n=1 Tax=Zopfia rhizophila CBS 207.26 TaxID=1314779 RepID=A0A6A6DK03_9PEZI|nr:hypothetical protein K469DRAFT_596538 [Zopfia rhizophila CBS 207.26]